MAEAEKQGQGGKEMQVGRRRDQRWNVSVKCPRNTEGSMQEGGGHWCESLVAVWIPKGLSPKARLSNQEFPDSWGQVEKMSCQLLQEHEAAPHPPVASRLCLTLDPVFGPCLPPSQLLVFPTFLFLPHALHQCSQMGARENHWQVRKTTAEH